MVKAELSYNPYLLETQVSFNGVPPRINSLVEKYRGSKLQTWIDELPRVFYDEMNGYDFELSFSGTDLDFEELERAFSRAGVGADLVRLFHKGHIGGRGEKVREINELAEWLDENPNHRFDWTSFRGRNKELLEWVYPLIVIGGLPTEDGLLTSERLFFGDIDTSVETFASADELRATDLSSTPILVVVDRRSSKAIPHTLLELLSRDDVRQEQLFFLITYDPDKVGRVIRDLGIAEPRIVASPHDERIARYLEIYAVSERIHDSIKVFRGQIDELDRVLREDNRRSKIANWGVHEKMMELDDALGRLKTTYDLFANRDNLDCPAEFEDAKASLLHEIGSWRAKKTKIDRLDDAERLSREYEETIMWHFDRFRQEVNRVFLSACHEIDDHAHEWYECALCNDDFSADAPIDLPSFECSSPVLSAALMQLKSERYVTPKEDLLGSFGRFFGNASDVAPQEAVLETVYYCEKWRNYAEGIMGKIADGIILEACSALEKRLSHLSDAYLSHIDDLIRSFSEDKRRVSAQLSADEQLLQADNDWCSAFRDKLHAIERF